MSRFAGKGLKRESMFKMFFDRRGRRQGFDRGHAGEGYRNGSGRNSRDRVFEKTRDLAGETENRALTRSLQENIGKIEKIFAGDSTLTIRQFENQKYKQWKCCIFYIDGMVKSQAVNEDILYPLIYSQLDDSGTSADLLGLLEKKVVAVNSVTRTPDLDEMVGAILYGDTLLLVEGSEEGLVFGTKGWQTRAVTESQSERVLRGPRESFIESIRINLSLLRRRLLTPDLKFKSKELGRRTRTKACVAYIEGIVQEKILKELEKRLDEIDIDCVLGAGYVEEFIRDAPLSPFGTVSATERPDVVAGKLLEGRIALFIDGTPFVLVLPYIFQEHFQSPEDYNQGFLFSSINRILRMLGFFLTISVPAVYVAITTFHQEMIPTPLVLSISAARRGVPFPTIVEAFLMLFFFEVLREGGIRLPSGIGEAISIVGALVLGEAAVNARLVSAPMVIVTALTGITGFLIPRMMGTVIIMRVSFLLLSAFFGLYGYVFGVIGLFIHLMSLRSLGVPYMMNYGSVRPEDIKDLYVRAPWWVMNLRPRMMTADRVRQKRTSDGGRV